MSEYPFELITSVKTVFDGSVSHIRLPAWDGLLGALANHAPMICAIRHGVLEITSEGKKLWFAVTDGVLEVCNGKAVLLTAWAEKADSAEQAKADANAAYDREHRAGAL